jgi:branched-chain amino acid transport system substrate-binding protein
MLLATACGSSSDDSEGAGGAGGGQVETVRIAVVAPLSGAYTIYGKPIEDGAQLAVDEINATGGVSGGGLENVQLQLVPFDDQLDPKQAADAAQKVVDDPSIWAFTGLAGSDSALAAKPILNRAGVPLISSFASSPEITAGARRTFIVASPHGAYAYGGVQAAKDAGADKVAILQITGEFGDSISNLAQEAARAKGMTVTTVQTMNSGDTDVQVQVLAAKDSGADTLLTVGYASDVVAAVTAAEKLQWDPRIVDVGGGAFDPSVLENAGPAAEGLIGVVDYDASSSTPANQAFTSAYKERFGSADVPPPAAHGYETVKAIAAALAMGPLNREELGDDLYDVSLPDTGVGALSFDDNGNPLGRPMWVFRVQDGAFVFDHGYTYDGKDVQPQDLARP